MGQLTDIPYSELKKDERAYEVMLLRDLYDNTFSDIAKEFETSNTRIIQIYNKTKVKQLRLYIRHLAVINGHENTIFFRKICETAYECYQDFRYVTVYFEKEYGKILTEYRAGEPGIPDQFIAMLPPLIEELSDETIDRVIQLREIEKKTYTAIGNELQMTAEKADRIYDLYYHKKVLAFLDIIEEKTGNDVSDYYFKVSYKAKKRYDLILRDYPKLFE